MFIFSFINRQIVSILQDHLNINKTYHFSPTDVSTIHQIQTSSHHRNPNKIITRIHFLKRTSMMLSPSFQPPPPLQIGLRGFLYQRLRLAMMSRSGAQTAIAKHQFSHPERPIATERGLQLRSPTAIMPAFLVDRGVFVFIFLFVDIFLGF